MKIAFDVDVLAKQMSINDYVHKVADWGYKYIEQSPHPRINPFYKHPLFSKECQQEYKQALKETGVEISSFIVVYRWSGPTEEQRQQVRNRTMESWYFPLPEEFYDDIMDYAGCRADQTNALDGTTNPGCIFPEHYDAPRGGESLYVNVATTQPVYAPARGYVYYAYDQHWGNVAVIENPVDAGYSYYLVLGNVVPDGSIASGTYMDAGLAIGTVNGELRFTALMDASGKAEEIASDVEKALENLSWLLDSTGTGLVCVNPIDNATHGGPIRYGFVPQQPAVEPTVPETTEPPMTEPPVTEPPVTEPPVTEPPVTEPPATEHQHDYVATVIRQPTHLTEGEVQYICACGDNYIEAIPKLPEHTFDQQVVSDAYLASAATPDSPAYYYYSCLCGEKGDLCLW
mgnify:CR=1 FL=1